MKSFFHDGTKYTITGNNNLAMSHFHEVRAHLHNMKLANVYDLSILTGIKNFDDGTEVTYSLIHGIEEITIDAPIETEKNPEKIVEKPIDRILPVMRCTENRYWVVCLSGTFEPPYMVFKNIFDIPEDEMDDNVENEMDNKLISVRGDMQLFFVAQTGLMPDKISSTEIPDAEPISSAPINNVTGYLCSPVWYREDMCHSGINVPVYQAKYYQKFQYSPINNNYESYLLCDGIQIDLPISIGSYSKTHTGWDSSTGPDSYIWYFGGIYPCPDPTIFSNEVYPDYLASVVDSDQYINSVMPDSILAGDVNFADEIHVNSISISISFPSGKYSVRYESATAFCALYYSNTLNSTFDLTPPAGPPWCSTVPDGTSSSSENEQEAYFIRLDEKEFPIVGNSEYPEPVQGDNQAKYYGKDSQAGISCIMSAGLMNADYDFTAIEYYYIGKNNRTKLTTTSFETLENDFKHSIQDMDELNDVIFEGKIFMAKLEEGSLIKTIG